MKPNLFSSKIIYLIYLLAILCLLTQHVEATMVLWHQKADLEQMKYNITTTVRSASTSELLDMVTSKWYQGYGEPALNEIVNRGYREAIPVLESLSTVLHDPRSSNFSKSIVNLDIIEELQGKDDSQQLESLLYYKKKYSPQKDEYKNESFFLGFHSLKAVRYYGATILIAEKRDKLYSQGMLKEIRNIFEKFVNDDDMCIKGEANSLVTQIDNDIKDRELRANRLNELQQLTTDKLIAIISKPNNSVQVQNNLTPYDAFMACRILRERKALNAIPALKSFAFQTAGQNASAEAIREACKSIIALENSDSLSGKTVEEQAREILRIHKQAWSKLGPGHQRRSPEQGLDSYEQIIEFGCDSLLQELIKQDRASVEKVLYISE